MYNIQIKQTGKSLLESLIAEDVFVENPCNGRGLCGKCKVRILEGRCTPIQESEARLLTPEEIQLGIRLACIAEPLEDLVVEVLQKEREHKVLTTGYRPEFVFHPKAINYGIAVDIGTTTVAISLVNMKTGEELAEASMINAQKRYGLDVLTRITYEYENPDTGIADLQKVLVDSLNAMIEEVCYEGKISRTEVEEIVVSANCTMLHTLLGVDAKSIGKAPYHPQFTKAQDIEAVSIGIKAGEHTRLYCLPSVSAFIGGDIVAGAYVCGLQKEPGCILFIDIGTNGEIVLADHGHLLSCSCAAGPALEGMNISCGTRAASGAIEDVKITEEGVILTTIEQEPAMGICGSGILAVVKELIRTGLVKKSGAFIKRSELDPLDYRYSMIQENGKKREFILSEHPKFLITQSDIRQVQLAKGAILSGFNALLKVAGKEMKDLDKVLIAGQFGAHLSKDSLTGTGILPQEIQSKLEYLGNSAKTGAYMALMSEEIKREMEELAMAVDYMELAETKGYERVFTDSLIFPEL